MVDFGSWAEGTDFTLPLIPFSGEIHERIAALEVHWRKEQGGLRDGHFKVIGYERAPVLILHGQPLLTRFALAGTVRMPG